jgi:hypothetical protein
VKGAKPMRDQALTKREEARLINACQRVLLGGGFPNPERAGCPGIEILRAMAFRKLGIGQVEDWIEHLGTCTPCFREYTEFRRKLEWRRRSAYVGMAAAVIVVILSVGRWRWHPGQQTIATAHNHIVADMRNRLVLRGDQGSGKGPLVFKRGFDEVSFYLPDGSRAGTYDVAIFRKELGEALATASGTATIENGMTAMNVALDLSRTPPGYYLVGIRLPETDWNYYPLIVK